MPDNATNIDARAHEDRRRTRFSLIAVLVIVLGGLALVLLPTQAGSDPSTQLTRDTGSAHVLSTPPTTLPVADNASVDEPQRAAATAPSTPSSPPGYGCAAALAYLTADANPEFTFSCPGYADGNEAMTCVNIPGLCGGEHLVVINDPCPAAYMNEAYNSQSWSDTEGRFTRPIDPYGAC